MTSPPTAAQGAMGSMRRGGAVSPQATKEKDALDYPFAGSAVVDPPKSGLLHVVRGDDLTEAFGSARTSSPSFYNFFMDGIAEEFLC